MPEKIELEVNEAGDCVVFAARGELDMDSSPQLLQMVKDSLPRAKCVKLDLSGVSYIDSSGIAVLIQGLKIARKSSVDYVLLDVSQQVMSVIELSQLSAFFVFEKSGEA